MIRRPPPEFLVRGVGIHAEESRGLALPPPQVGTQHWRFGVVCELAHPDLLAPSADPQLRYAGRTQVAHPLRGATRRHEIAGASDLDGVDRHLLHLPRLAPAYCQHLRAMYTEA